MGAMATQVMLDRADTRERLADAGASIDRVIFDSPLVNMEANFYSEARQKLPLPTFMMTGAMLFFDARQDLELERMRFSVLRAGLPEKLLVLQARNDTKTLAVLLEEELALMSAAEKPRVHFFETGQHVQAFQTPANRERYIKLVADFLNE